MSRFLLNFLGITKMMRNLKRFFPYWQEPAKGRLGPRWIFLRALAVVFFSAFYSLLLQIDGLIGPDGILPAREYLDWLAHHMGLARFWLAPSLYWFGSSAHALQGLCWAGLAASVFLFLNYWPKGMVAFCTLAFLSFVS